jgi:hypothetical protein
VTGDSHDRIWLTNDGAFHNRTLWDKIFPDGTSYEGHFVTIHISHGLLHENRGQFNPKPVRFYTAAVYKRAAGG